jgi:hypothetical protein
MGYLRLQSAGERRRTPPEAQQLTKKRGRIGSQFLSLSLTETDGSADREPATYRKRRNEVRSDRRHSTALCGCDYGHVLKGVPVDCDDALLFEIGEDGHLYAGENGEEFDDFLHSEPQHTADDHSASALREKLWCVDFHCQSFSE